MRTRKFTVTIILTAMLIILTACGNTAQLNKNSQEVFKPAQSVQNIGLNEAVNVVKNMIRMDYTHYQLDMINDNFNYNGNQYYQFVISDPSEAIGPSIIVSKNNGTILCYYANDTVTEVYKDEIFKSKC